MNIKVETEFLAKDAKKAVGRGDLIIVIDALRCCSSIITALANGARAVIPVKTLREAYRIRAMNPDYLLAGERSGVKPRGFDLGNSPLEYTREKVFGKIIVMTTTSGTIALTFSESSKHVFIGSFLNAKTVAERAFEIASAENVNISIVQSGMGGKFSLEDFICAGAIISRMPQECIEPSDKALASFLAFKYAENDLYTTVMESSHSKKLIELGFARDIEFSCRLDVFQIAPIYREGKVVRGV